MPSPRSAIATTSVVPVSSDNASSNGSVSALVTARVSALARSGSTTSIAPCVAAARTRARSASISATAEGVRSVATTAARRASPGRDAIEGRPVAASGDAGRGAASSASAVMV